MINRIHKQKGGINLAETTKMEDILLAIKELGVNLNEVNTKVGNIETEIKGIKHEMKEMKQDVRLVDEKLDVLSVDSVKARAEIKILKREKNFN